MIPVLETHRYRLIAPDQNCFALYQRFYTDAQASVAYGGPLTADQSWARLKADLGSWYLLGFGVWVIQSKDSGALLGVCGFWQGCGWPTELTWWLLPEYRGQGIAMEASHAVLQHAFEAWQWPCVRTYMNDDNDAARALVLRLGGTFAGRQYFPDGIARNMYELYRP